MSLIYNTPVGRLILIDEDEGAAPLAHLASLPDPHKVNGQYFNKLKPNACTSRRARDTELAKALWERSETLLDLHDTQ
jgi:hypothetical protein